MSKRSAAVGMPSFMGPAKKQRSTEPLAKDSLSLSKDDLISKRDHLEVVQLLVGLRGAYQQLQARYREIEEELYDVEHETREYAEVIEELGMKLIGDEHELKARIADNEKQIDILLKDMKVYEEENNELETLNKENATKIARLEAQIAKIAAKPRRNTAVAKQDSFDVRQQAEQLQEVMRSAIRVQLKWAPSCKTSGKRWSYTCIVPSADVFYTLFNMNGAAELAAKKQWKQKKISIHDFREIFGTCIVKIQYDTLELVGKDVMLKWDAGANSFTVSGKYGVTAIAYLE